MALRPEYSLGHSEYNDFLFAFIQHPFIAKFFNIWLVGYYLEASVC